MGVAADLVNSDLETDGFRLGTPSLVCRWRLASRKLPLANRHLRALGQRSLNGESLSTQLVAWAKQHIEWTLSEGAGAYPNGVLMIIVDEDGQAAMTIGPYEELEVATASALAQRALNASVEGGETGVSPESLWLFHDGEFIWGIGPDERPSGAATLMNDLAETCGYPVVRRELLAEDFLAGEVDYEEVLLVSDEHGIVAASDATGSRSERFVKGYATLLEKAGRH